MSPYDEAHALARAISSCDEVKAYSEARQKVMSDPAKREMVRDFEQQQVDLELDRLQGKEPDADKMEKLRKLYELLRLNPPVAEFLEAQNRLGRMINDVQKIIGDALKPVLEPEEEKSS